MISPKFVLNLGMAVLLWILLSVGVRAALALTKYVGG